MEKLTYEFVKAQFEKEDYELLSKEYVNSRSKLKYRCPKGHIHSICWDSWWNGSRCFICFGKIKKTMEFVRSEFEKEDYVLLSTEYINAHKKLNYICQEGHQHSISWNHWKSGKRCFYCAGQDKPVIEFIRSEFEKESYKLLTRDYKNNKQKLDYICPNNHKHSITWSKWQQGQRCPYCKGSISKGEIEVRDFIKSLNIKVLANDKNTIVSPITNYPLELDIFMPDLSKAIEYNGEYWHQDKNRDLFKQKLCKSKMIDLLTIWENDWKIHNDACKSKIKEFIFK